jgi:SHAQKYF class myb-like DNA-binding protein
MMEPMIHIHPTIDCFQLFNKTVTTSNLPTQENSYNQRATTLPSISSTITTQSSIPVTSAKVKRVSPSLCSYQYQPYSNNSQYRKKLPSLITPEDTTKSQLYVSERYETPTPSTPSSPPPRYSPQQQHQTQHLYSPVQAQPHPFQPRCDDTTSFYYQSPTSAPAVAESSPTKQAQTKSMGKGDWTEEEHDRFLKGYNEVGCQWKIVAEQYVKTRDRRQTSSHAQNFLKKLKKEQDKNRR